MQVLSLMSFCFCLFVFFFSLMLTGAFVSTTKQENEFKKVTGLAERFVILLFAFYIELKKTVGIKGKVTGCHSTSLSQCFLFQQVVIPPFMPQDWFSMDMSSLPALSASHLLCPCSCESWNCEK